MLLSLSYRIPYLLGRVSLNYQKKNSVSYRYPAFEFVICNLKEFILKSVAEKTSFQLTKQRYHKLCISVSMG